MTTLHTGIASPTPTAIADRLVIRFLAGETMLASEIAQEFGVTRDSARAAVRISRDVLLDTYNVVLPIPNYEGDYLLGISTSAMDAFLGEVPQLRALRTRQRNLMRRMNGAMSLVKSQPRLGAKLLRTLESGISHLDDVLDSTIQFMDDEIDRSRETTPAVN